MTIIEQSSHNPLDEDEKRERRSMYVCGLSKIIQQGIFFDRDQLSLINGWYQRSSFPGSVH